MPTRTLSSADIVAEQPDVLEGPADAERRHLVRLQGHRSIAALGDDRLAIEGDLAGRSAE